MNEVLCYIYLSVLDPSYMGGSWIHGHVEFNSKFSNFQKGLLFCLFLKYCSKFESLVDHFWNPYLGQ